MKKDSSRTRRTKADRGSSRTANMTDQDTNTTETMTDTENTTRTGTKQTNRARRGEKIPVKVKEVYFEQEPEPVTGKGRNTELGIVTYTFVFLFLLMIGYLSYINIFKADELNSNSYNTKQDANTDKYIRGSILSADGSVLARTDV